MLQSASTEAAQTGSRSTRVVAAAALIAAIFYYPVFPLSGRVSFARLLALPRVVDGALNTQLWEKRSI